MKANDKDENGNMPTHINAFQLIGMSSFLDLSGFFEKEVWLLFLSDCLIKSCTSMLRSRFNTVQDVSERKIRFTSNFSPKDLFEKIEDIVRRLGFQVQKGHGKVLLSFHSNNSCAFV